MANTLAPLASVGSIGELLKQLGGIPAARVRFHPIPGTATEADVLALLEAPRKRLCELIDGTLVEKPVGLAESLLASFLCEMLNAFVRMRNLGIVSAPDGPFRLFAGRVRYPDVAFTSWDRIPRRRRPKKPIPHLAPDLAIEILSRTNTRAEMARKRKDYFAAGVRLVWEIDPRTKTVQVYTDASTSTTLREKDTLDGRPVLPGFRLRLRDLFGEMERNG